MSLEESDPFPPIKAMPPFRAVGGNVLLRKVAMDVHRGMLVVYNGGGGQILQLGEIVGLGGRWTQDRPWQPPMPAIRHPTIDTKKGQVPDPAWKPPLPHLIPRALPARFDQGHIDALDSLKPGDLVVYIQARAYDVFEWEGQDILVYPGNWLHGRVEDSELANHPELRRYMQDNFDTEAPDRKLHG